MRSLHRGGWQESGMNGQFRNLTKKYSSLCEGAGGGGQPTDPQG